MAAKKRKTHVAKMYDALATLLRIPGSDWTCAALEHNSAIVSLHPYQNQVRDILDYFVRDGYATKEKKVALAPPLRKVTHFKWRDDAPPFEYVYMYKPKLTTAPIQCTVNDIPGGQEIRVEGAVITVGRNPENNRIRVTVELT